MTQKTNQIITGVFTEQIPTSATTNNVEDKVEVELKKIKKTNVMKEC